MITRRYRSIFACVIMLGLAIPGAAIADNNGKGCSLLGSWFGVDTLEDKNLTGWMVTATGKSEKRGTNYFEYPNFDPTFFGYFPTAVRLSNSVGTWQRTGGNTFEYSFIGLALDATNQLVGILKTSGEIALSDDCNSETLTATVYLYDPAQGPFTDEPFQVVPFPELYGYRVQLD
jgi:hypothetical protein